VYRWIQRSVRIKQLQEFLKSDHWLRRCCILFGGAFYFEPPCTSRTNLGLVIFCKNVLFLVVISLALLVYAWFIACYILVSLALS